MQWLWSTVEFLQRAELAKHSNQDKAYEVSTNH
jgi:hypothetical protein